MSDLPRISRNFDGSDYDPELDGARLSGQLLRVYEVMRDGEWHTIPEVQSECRRRFGYQIMDASVGKHIRHLRYERFGHFIVDKRRIDESGLWEYRVAGVAPVEVAS